MRATQHASNNSVLGAPEGVSHDVCVSIPVTQVQYEDGTPAIRSYWRPSPAELKALNGGSLVCLEIWGRTHAPMILSVDGVPE